MSNEQKYGEVNWTDESLNNELKGKGKDQFLKLKPGSNLIRVLTLPFQYYQHKYKFTEKDFGQRIYCSAKHGFCPVCAKGDRPKKRWYLGVIDRPSNSYKILDINRSILDDVQTYARDEDWGDPIQYDFDIVVNPHAGPMGYYKAVAKPKRPLSATDLVIKESVNIADLERRCAPPEPKKVEERFQALMEKFLGEGSGSSIEKPVSFSSNEEENDFPDSDAKALVSPFDRK